MNVALRVVVTIWTSTCRPAVSVYENEVKAVPVQVWTGPGDSRELGIQEFLDNQHMKMARLLVLRTGRLYLPECTPVIRIC